MLPQSLSGLIVHGAEPVRGAVNAESEEINQQIGDIGYTEVRSPVPSLVCNHGVSSQPGALLRYA